MKKLNYFNLSFGDITVNDKVDDKKITDDKNNVDVMKSKNKAGIKPNQN